MLSIFHSEVESVMFLRTAIMQTVMCKRAVAWHPWNIYGRLKTLLARWRESHCVGVCACANWNGLVTAFISSSLHTYAPFLLRCFSLLLACLFCSMEIPWICS
jgi:hypothetical protein